MEKEKWSWVSNAQSDSPPLVQIILALRQGCREIYSHNKAIGLYGNPSTNQLDLLASGSLAGPFLRLPGINSEILDQSLFKKKKKKKGLPKSGLSAAKESPMWKPGRI